jgi:hypothetical protein
MAQIEDGRICMLDALAKLVALCSLFWIVAAGTGSFSAFKEQWDRGSFIQELDEANAETLVPHDCETARGRYGIDFGLHKSWPPDPIDLFGPPLFARCYYPISNYRALYPEVARLTDSEIAYQLTREQHIDIIEPHYWPVIWRGLLFTLGPPFAVFASLIGLSLLIAWTADAIHLRSAARMPTVAPVAQSPSPPNKPARLKRLRRTRRKSSSSGSGT